MSILSRHWTGRATAIFTAFAALVWTGSAGVAEAARARLDAVRAGRHDGFTRVVLDLSARAPYAIEEDPAAGVVDVVVRGASPGSFAAPDLSDDPLVAGLESRRAGSNTTVRLRVRAFPSEIRHFTLDRPYRVVVDLQDAKSAPAAAEARPRPAPAAEDARAEPSAAPAAAPARIAEASPALPLPPPVADAVSAPVTTAESEASDPPAEISPSPAAFAPTDVEAPPDEDPDAWLKADDESAPARAAPGPVVQGAEGIEALRSQSVVRRGVFEAVVIAEPSHRMALQMVQDALPHDVWRRLEQAAELIEVGRLQEAADLYRAVLASHDAGEFGALVWTVYGDVRVWQSLLSGRERYIEAIDAYKRARRLAPKPPLDLWFRLATAYHLIGFTHEANEEYEHAVRHGRGSLFEVYGEMELAKLQLIEGKYFDAFRRLVHLVGRIQGEPRRDALLLLAEANYRHENYFFALDNYRELEAGWPGEIAGRLDTELHYALTLGRNGVYEDAITRLQRLLDRLPDRPDLMLQVARFYRDLGKRDEAEAYYQRIAGDYDGTEPAFRARIALVEVRFGGAKPAEPSEALAKALDLIYEDYSSSPFSAELLYRTGELYLSLDDPKTALDRFNLLGRRYIESHWNVQAQGPRSQAVLRRFDQLVEQKNPNELIHFFRSERKFFLGTFRDGYFHRHAGDAMVRVGSLGEAAETYREASAVMIEGPNKEYFDVRRLELLFELGRVDQARDAIERYLEEYPKGAYRAEALIAKGNFLERTDSWKEAARFFDEAVVVSADPVVRARALAGLGYCRWRLLEYAKAVPAYREAVLAWPKDRRKSESDRRFAGNLYYHLALSQFAIKANEDAILAFREVRSMHPDPERVAWSRFYEARALEALGRTNEALGILDALAGTTEDALFRRAVEQMAAELRWPAERKRLSQRWKDGA